MSDQTLDPGDSGRGSNTPDPTPQPVNGDGGLSGYEPVLVDYSREQSSRPVVSHDYHDTSGDVGPRERLGPPAPATPSSSTDNTPRMGLDTTRRGDRGDAPTAYGSHAVQAADQTPVQSAQPAQSAQTKAADPLGDAIAAANGTSSGGGGGGGGGGAAMPSIPSPVVSNSAGGGGGGSSLGLLLVTVGGGVVAIYLYQKYARKGHKKEGE